MKNHWLLLYLLQLVVPLTSHSETEAESGSRILTIVEKGISSLGFYTEEGSRIKTIELEIIPHEMRFSADKKRAYITNTGAIRYTEEVEGGTSIFVIDLHYMPKQRLLPRCRLCSSCGCFEIWESPH